MARRARSRRGPLMFDASGAPVEAARGDALRGDNGMGDYSVVSRQVPNGTPLPAGLENVTVSVDFPSAGITTWYYPSALAYLIGNIGAAADTVTDTAGTVADRVGAVLGDARSLFPLVLTVAGVYFLYRVLGSVRQ